MKRRVWITILTLCLVAVCLPGSLGATRYRYQDMDLQGLQLTRRAWNPDIIRAVNDSCWIVGSYYYDELNIYRPYVWRPHWGGSALELGGYYRGYANGINNAGQIVGELFMGLDTFQPHYPCLWTWPSPSMSQRTTLYAFPPQQPSGYFPQVETPANGINDGGQITGSVVFDTSTTNTIAATYTTPQELPVSLGTLGGTKSLGNGINNANYVVGTALDTSGHKRACLWVPGAAPLNVAPKGDFSYGNAINNQGNVVGRVESPSGVGMGHAFFWDRLTQEIQDMCPNDYASNPNGLSDHNQAVGEVYDNSNHPTGVFYWTPADKKRDLNTLVVNLPAGVTLQTAAAISPSGKYIVGFDSQNHVYLLTAIKALPLLELMLMD